MGGVWHTSRHMDKKTFLTMDPSRMKKMPPPGKMPPNGSGSSRMNGRAEEPSHGERIAQLEVLIQNCATKADLEKFKGEIKAEMAELRAEMAEFKGEMKAELAALHGRMDALDEKIERVRSEIKEQIQASANSNLKWMLGIMLPFFTLLMTVFKFL